MSTTTFADVISSARFTLLDAAGVAWTELELIRYTNEAVAATCSGKPDAYTVRGQLELDEGVQQTLPPDSTGLVDIIMNAASKTIVTQVDKELLVESNRFYPAGATSADIEHYAADPREPQRFLVSPPAAEAAAVVAVYGAVPEPGGSLDSVYPLSRAYLPSTIDYVVARAYGKNSKRQDLGKETYHMQRWAAALGLRAQSQAALAPRVSQSPGV